MKKRVILLVCLLLSALILSGCTLMPLMMSLSSTGGSKTVQSEPAAAAETETAPDTVTISRAEYERYKQLDKVLELMDDVDAYFYQETDKDTLISGAAAGVLNSLKDPYTFYYTPEDYAKLWEDDEGEYAGVGLLISTSYVTGICTISRVFKGTPAEAAGVQRGDILYKVEDLMCNMDTINDAVDIMRGEPGTDVTVVFLRGEEEITVTMTRAIVNVTRAESTILDNGIGYLALYEFQGDCTQRVEEYLQEMVDANVKGIILDLRDNPGGWVDSAQNIGNFFLDKGIVCSVKDKYGNTDYYYTSEGKMIDVPLVVLVNENSASSAEILTGALKDRADATVVGVNTYGKGIMQAVIPVGSDGSGAQITVAQYFTPNGTVVHGVGLAPDVVAELPEGDKGVYQFADMNDPQLAKAYEVMLEKLGVKD